jgi:hypothetical protein
MEKVGALCRQSEQERLRGIHDFPTWSRAKQMLELAKLHHSQMQALQVRHHNHYCQ